MEIILSVLFIIGFVAYFKIKGVGARNYSQSHQIDWGKANDDRIMNDLTNSQVNQNILNGKYNITVTKKNESWEDFKRRHPNGSWN